MVRALNFKSHFIEREGNITARVLPLIKRRNVEIFGHIARRERRQPVLAKRKKEKLAFGFYQDIISHGLSLFKRLF
ncbi:hypothetical protein SDC9_185255 [bioreactor metagenome]|uniref:Uncharacterized protein n=1 Tax=bioreactor metagenome TaxID=1076179 RepID=A0A645HNP8_9ZZZZ